MDETSETPSNGTPSDTSPSNGPSSGSGPISPDAISRAQQSLGNGDLSADPTTTPSPERDPAASPDPSVGGPASRPPTDDRRTKECVGLATAAVSAVPPTLRILDVADVRLTDTETRQLGEAYGKVLRWYFEITEGTKKGDHLKAGAVTVEILQKKLEEIERNQSTRNETDGSSDNVGGRANGKREDDAH